MPPNLSSVEQLEKVISKKIKSYRGHPKEAEKIIHGIHIIENNTDLSAEDKKKLHEMIEKVRMIGKEKVRKTRKVKARLSGGACGTCAQPPQYGGAVSRNLIGSVGSLSELQTISQNEGDAYVNLEDGKIYKSTNGIWEVSGTWSGAQNGITGNTGPQGATGIQGLPGIYGPTGPQGPSGPVGPIGYTGPDGYMGSTGFVGPDGPRGDTGPDGISYIGPQGKPGDTGDIGVGYVGPTGPFGPLGPKGPDGPKGYLGPMGPTNTGTIGDPGPQGPPGVTGPKGDHGIDGVGFQGPQGALGPQGPQGFMGAKGPTSAVGETGPQGVQGPTGISYSTTFSYRGNFNANTMYSPGDIVKYAETNPTSALYKNNSTSPVLYVFKSIPVDILPDHGGWWANSTRSAANFNSPLARGIYCPLVPPYIGPSFYYRDSNNNLQEFVVPAGTTDITTLEGYNKIYGICQGPIDITSTGITDTSYQNLSSYTNFSKVNDCFSSLETYNWNTSGLFSSSKRPFGPTTTKTGKPFLGPRIFGPGITTSTHVIKGEVISIRGTMRYDADLLGATTTTTTQPTTTTTTQGRRPFVPTDALTNSEILIKNWYDAADPFATGTPPALNTNITTLKDKSGSGNDAVRMDGDMTAYQISYGNGSYEIPLKSDSNGYYLQFNRGYYQMPLTASWTDTNPASIFAVFYAGDAQIIPVIAVQNGSGMLIQTDSNSNGGMLYAEYGSGRTRVNKALPNGSVRNKELIVSLITTSSTFNAYLNGNFLESQPSDGTGKPDPNRNPTWPKIGYDGVWGTSGQLRLREILIYQGTLNTENQQKVEGYLAWKWRINTNLPSTHPYFNSAPFILLPPPSTTTTTTTMAPIVNRHTNTEAKTIRWTLDNPIDLTKLNRNYLYSPSSSASLTSLIAPANTYRIHHILPTQITDSDAILLGAASPLTQSGGMVLDNIHGGSYEPYEKVVRYYNKQSVSVTPIAKGKKGKGKTHRR